MSREIIGHVIKDEAPKAPVYLYSINNPVSIKVSNDETNPDMQRELLSINQAMLYSALEDIDMVVPFDQIKLGEKTKKYFEPVDNAFTATGIYSMVYSNILDTLVGDKQMDMTEFTKYSLYGGTNIHFLTPQLQVPLPHYGD